MYHLEVKTSNRSYSLWFESESERDAFASALWTWTLTRGGPIFSVNKSHRYLPRKV